MKVAVKYCGGCNAAYRREEVEEILSKHFEIFYSNEGNLVVCISGCKKGCAVEGVKGEVLHVDGRVSEEELMRMVEKKLKSLR